MNPPTAPFGHSWLFLACLLLSTASHGLETDQFYAWGKPIEDSTGYLNAWVIITVQKALDARQGDRDLDCEGAVRHIQRRLQHSIYQPIELWVTSGDLVDRFPRRLDEYRDYRSHYLLSKTYPLDFARWLPPSPTVEVDGIRFGTDKLAHFFSEGWWYYRHWKKHRDSLTANEMQKKLLEYGVLLENWIQGKTLTGVISFGDMESNYQGFIFYHQLCHGDPPLLQRQGEQWRITGAFDFRDYVTPEWDESWNANIYSPVRWKNIRKTMESYCPMLESEWVIRQRAYYGQRDTLTPTEKLLRERVASGELPDPRNYDITTVCRSSETVVAQ